MRLGFLGVAAIGALLAGGPGAWAFQFVNPDTNPDGTSSKFSTDLDQNHMSTPNSRFQLNDSGNTRTGTLKFGSTTLQFGVSGGNNNYDPSPAIQERFLQSPAARTVPSQAGW